MLRSDLRTLIIDDFVCQQLLSQLRILDSAIDYFALEIVSIGDWGGPDFLLVPYDRFWSLESTFGVLWSVWSSGLWEFQFRRFENLAPVSNSKPEIGLRFAPNSVSCSKRSLSDVCVGFPEACPAPIIDRIHFRSKTNGWAVMIFRLRQQPCAHEMIDDMTSEIASGHQNLSYGTSKCPQIPRLLSRTHGKIRKNLKPKFVNRKSYIPNKYPTSFSNPCTLQCHVVTAYYGL